MTELATEFTYLNLQKTLLFDNLGPVNRSSDKVNFETLGRSLR